MADPLDPSPAASDPLNPGTSSAAAASNATLTDTCDIARKLPWNDDGMGGDSSYGSDPWPIIASDVPCLLEAPTLPKEVKQAGAEVALLTWKLQLPLGTDVRMVDRILKDGLIYEVTNVNTGQTGATVLVAYLIRRNL